MPVIDSPRYDQKISSSVKLRNIRDVAETKLGIPASALTSFGDYKAKVSLDYSTAHDEKSSNGKLVLVTSATPTPSGEGKTTTSIGLVDALNRVGCRAAACLREPSLGPCFGIKGAAHGGGRSQAAPMVDINLHFTGDIHAVTTANNLLSAMIDNHVYWGNEPELDVDQLSWKRALDLNDRTLRQANLKLRCDKEQQTGFNITAASEVMAVLCLASGQNDLKRRLGNIVIGCSATGAAIRARDLEADSAMAVLLHEALRPNLVQSLEHNPVFIHGGPFANIAHGCSSVIATKTGLSLCDVVVTEAGFGADLGSENFLNIKCRQSGLQPDAVVIVCSIRALKWHSGVHLNNLNSPSPDAVKIGSKNLTRHINNLKEFGVIPIVAINQFTSDSNAEIDIVHESAQAAGALSVTCSHWADGGSGAADLAEAVLCTVNDQEHKFQFLYPDSYSLKQKIETVAERIYHASKVDFSETAQNKIAVFESWGFGTLPVCIAKTLYSFSASPGNLGISTGHVLPVRDVNLSAGAEFVVVVCGNVMTMPGLPRRPAAVDFGFDDEGTIIGL